ncbi:unnamed protein product [Effrenium voratum]|nr:unnamed protein product [Effrenium voratum]
MSLHDGKQATAVLQTLQREQGAGAAARALRAMEMRQLKVNAFHYNTVLSGFGAAGNWCAANRTFMEMRERNIEPTVVSYGLLLANSADWRLSRELLEQIRIHSLQANEVLLTSATQGQRWRLAFGTIRTMVAQQVLANAICCNAAGATLAKEARWREATQHFGRMRQVAIEPDAATYKTLRGSWRMALGILQKAFAASVQVTDTLANCAAASCADLLRWREVLALLFDMATMFIQSTVVSFNTAINVCSKLCLWRCASARLQAASEMLQPNTVTFNSSLGAMAWHRAAAVLCEMRRSQLAPDSLSCNSCISACERSGHWQPSLQLTGLDLQGFNAAISCSGSRWWNALQLFASMAERMQPSLVSQNAVLSACDKGGEWLRALSLLQAWHKQRTEQDAFTYNSSISACDWIQALRCFTIMASSWMSPDLVSYNALSHATGSAKMWTQSLSLFHDVRPDSASYGSALMACSSSWLLAVSILVTMRQEALRPAAGLVSTAVSACEQSWEPVRPQVLSQAMS